MHASITHEQYKEKKQDRQDGQDQRYRAGRMDVKNRSKIIFAKQNEARRTASFILLCKELLLGALLQAIGS